MGYWSIILPEAATNLITNPSFETNTTGWAASGTNTIASSTAEAKFGGYSLKATYQDTATLASYAATLTASTTYYLSCYIYVPTNWDGGNIRLNSSDYASASATYNTIYTDGTSSKDRWLYIETKLEIDSDAVGSITIDTTSAPTAGRFIYIDAVQCEANSSYATTYIDGDQDGCKWTGTEHGSTSSRDAQSRAGGQVYDLDDYGFYVTELTGFGMANVEPQVRSRALIPGAEYSGYRVPERQFALVGELEGSSWSNLHAKRQALIDAIKPDKVKGAQPFIMRYTGADDERPLEITCVYLGGLEFGQHTGFGEKIGLRIAAYDPFFYEIGNDVAHLTIPSALAVKYVIGKINGVWNDLGPPDAPGSYTSLTVMGIDSEYLYIAGAFTNWDNNADADNVARYNKSSGTWSALGATPMNSGISSFIDDPTGDLYVGGNFTDAGGDGDADYICKWDGSAFSALASGGTDTVTALALGQDGILYFGGDFTNWDAIAEADCIASWDGSSYAALGNGLPGWPTDLEIHPLNGDLYAITNTADYGLHIWDGTTWGGPGSSVFNASPRTMAFDNSGRLYIGGSFTTANSVSCNYIAMWNGSTFMPLGDGFDSTVRKVLWVDGYLYASGQFANSGDLSLPNRIARWNGSTWERIDINLPSGSGATYTMINDGNDLYLSFHAADDAYPSSKTTITNNGTGKAYPKFYIKRSGGTGVTISWIKNETTGDSINLDYSLQDEETLILDLSPNNRTCISSYYGSVWRAIMRSSDLASFCLLPGDNDITLLIEEEGSPTTTCYMTWRNTHWSSDGVA